MKTLDLNVLERALKHKIEISEEMARELAVRVMNYFGFGSDMLDNMLNQEDRRLFYFLQDLGLLETHWDETFLPTSGKSWRIFYWRLNLPKIRENAKVPEEEEQEEEGLYDTLPENVWSREGGFESA